MSKVRIFLPMLLLFSLAAAAQQRYALLLGVNKYYAQPGKLHPQSLRGCVNDARSMEALLTGRFGFPAAGVQLLTDAAVNRTTVLAALDARLAQCHSGDAFVFYFSGHGVWAENDRGNRSDPIKRGLAEGLVLSNLYAPGLDCLLFDQTLKSYFNRFVAKGVTVTAFFDCCFSGNMPAMGMVSYWPEPSPFNDDGKAFDAEVLMNLPDSNGTSRAYTLGNNVHVALAEEPRPADKPNSRFLSLSAATDRQLARDAVDENGLQHGAFTQALLSIYRRQAPGLRVDSLLARLTRLMNREGYQQEPTYHFDSARLSGNLTGTAADGQQAALSATCLAVRRGTITLSKGLVAGVAPGNRFRAGGTTFTISQSWPDSAHALLPRLARLRPGAVARCIDPWTRSGPMVRLFIPGLPRNTGWTRFWEKEVAPALPVMQDYYSWTVQIGALVTDLTGPAPLQRRIANPADATVRYTVLPLPPALRAALLQLLRRNQNFQLVSNADSADYVLYTNYATSTKTPAFLFFFHPPLSRRSDYGISIFSERTISVASLRTDPAALAAKLYALAQRTLRYRSINWINEDERR